MNWNPSWANAIASIESQGSGGYSAVGPTTQKGNRAYGKYQVMDFNIPTWTEKHLGQKLTPNQFLNSPEAQEAVFKGEFGSYVSKYGNPQDAASAWFTGRPQSAGANRSDVLGTTGSGYVSKFNNALGTGATSTGGQPMMQPEQKPKGLLGGLFSDPDKRARLAMALEGMTLNPNKGMIASLQGGIKQRGEDRKEAAAEAKQLAQTNKSLEFLASQPGGEDYVRLAEAAGVPTAMKAYLESKKASADGKDTALIRNALAAGFKPGTKEYQRFIASGGDIYSQETAMMLGLPKPEAGMTYEFEKGEAGNITGYKLVPIKGGSAELEAQQLADKKDKAQSGQDRKDVSFYAAGERILAELGKEGALLPATGLMATAARGTPLIRLFAQRQENVAQDLAIMESQAQFETLADLKAASPTGASGLGQLTDAERKALGKLNANFESSQSEPAIRRTIKSAMILKSYFENGILDPETNKYRNATDEELDQMSQGILPTTAEGKPLFGDVQRYFGETQDQTIDADDGQYTIKQVGK